MIATTKTELPKGIFNPKFKKRASRLTDWLLGKGIQADGVSKFTRAELLWLEINLHDKAPVYGLMNTFFPSFEWMSERYSFYNPLFLPFYYLKRISKK